MKTKFISSLFLILFISSSLIGQTTFTSDESHNRNQATFESNAPLEDIVGVSDRVKSKIEINLNDIRDSPKAYAAVHLASLKTGIDLRDKHLRSANWLDTEQYPYAEFVLTGLSDVSSGKLIEGEEISAAAAGDLSIHGVTKKITANVILRYFKESDKTKSRIAGNLLRVTADFTVKLSDFNISIPSVVEGKVDETIKVSANFIASDAN